jgi:hypothetical protein
MSSSASEIPAAPFHPRERRLVFGELLPILLRRHPFGGEALA